MTSAAIYARVSSARQKEQETIVSQTEALRAHAAQLGLDVPEEWVFEDDGHSGASLVRPALDALRDLVAQVPVDVVLCYSPDRLARKYAYQALLMEELARAGTSVVFVKAPSGDTPEDALLVQFQGMIAEYERAQIMERTRRGKNQRARSGSVNVLSGAPFGYRYVRKSDHAAARYEVVPHEAAIVAGLFRRYADEGIAIAELARWLGSTGVTTRTGKARWDRSTIWGMLRNPAYAGRACFGKTGRVSEQAGRNRVARLAGRATGTAYTTVDRPRGDWLEIDVPALVDEATFERVARRLADNKKFASRASKTPSLLQGLAACSGCGYACYRGHTTTSAGNKIFYYRCIGSDNYRFEHGKVCDSKPVRADYLDQVVWDHITGLLTDPSLIRAEIGKRLAQIRTADPATAQHKRLDDALAKTTSAITRLIGAYQEDLVSLDELRARMPELRARQTSLRHQIQALDAQLADREVYLKLAENLEGFLATLRKSAVTAAVEDRQRVVRLLVKEVLVGPGKIVIRHSIPTRADGSAPVPVSTDSDADAEPAPGSHLRWRSHHTALGSSLPGRREPFPSLENPCLQPPGDHIPRGETAEHSQQVLVADLVERACQVSIKNPHPPGFPVQGVKQGFYRVVAAAARPEPIRSGLEPGLPLGLQRITYPCLMAPIRNNRNSERPHFCLITGFRDIHPPDRGRLMRADRGVHPHRHLGPCLAGQRDQPIDPRGLAARIALRDLAHAYQRVMPAAQHQLLQVHGRGHVPFLHRLEDPAAQPPYLLLVAPPVHTLPGVTIETGAGPPVRSPRCPTCPSVPAFALASPQRLTCPRQRPFGPGHRPGIRPVIRGAIREEFPVLRPRFPAAFRPPAFASWAPCPAREFSPPYGRLTAPPAHTRAWDADPWHGFHVPHA